MASKLLNLIALSSLVVLLSSFGPTPVNALSIDNTPNIARSLGHAAIAKKRRADSRRCKPRPSSSSSVAPTSAPPTKPTPPPAPPAPTSTKQAPAPPPPSPTPKPNPPPANPGGGGGGGKVGLAWPNGDDPSLRFWKTGNVGTIYSWSPWKPAGTDQLGLEFAPMLWGEKQLGDFKRLVKPGYAHVALGFNEPDHAGQAEMSPGRAGQIWREVMNPLKNQGYSLGCPAVTSAPKGKQWMKDFFSQCSDCICDFVPLHWYGTNAQAFISYVQDFHNTFNRPIWVTEVACQNFGGPGGQCNQGQINSFMDTITSWMDNTGYVQKYFWFGVMKDMGNVNPQNGLMGGDGKPNALGWRYISS